MTRKRKITGGVLIGLATLVLCVYLDANAHPPQHDHSRCIVIASSILARYGLERGHYPYSTNGYGDAILSVTTNREDFRYFTAAGYDSKVFEFALEHSTHVPESECGRVYVQLPGTNRDPNIVILFDKKSRRGGREIDDARFIRDADWPAFTNRQIELLVTAGVSRRQAESYFDETK